MPPHDVISACILVCNKIQNSSKVSIDMLDVPQALYTTVYLCFTVSTTKTVTSSAARNLEGLPNTCCLSTVCKYFQLLLFFDITASCCFNQLWVTFTNTTASSCHLLPQSHSLHVQHSWFCTISIQIVPKRWNNSKSPTERCERSYILPTVTTVTLGKTLHHIQQCIICISINVQTKSSFAARKNA